MTLEEAFKETIGQFYQDAEDAGHPVPQSYRDMFRAIFFTGAAAAAKIVGNETVDILAEAETSVRSIVTHAVIDDLASDVDDLISELENK